MGEQSHTSSEGIPNSSKHSTDDPVDVKTIQEGISETEATSFSSFANEEGGVVKHNSREFTIIDSTINEEESSTADNLDDNESTDSLGSLVNQKWKESVRTEVNESSFVINFDRTDSRTPLFRMSSGFQKPIVITSEEDANKSSDEEDYDQFDSDRSGIVFPFSRKSSEYIKHTERRGSFLKQNEQSFTLSYGDGSNALRDKRSGQTFEGVSESRRAQFVMMSDTPTNKKFRITKNPEEMKKERIEALFYNKGMEMCLGVLYIAANALSAGYGAYTFTEIGGFTPPNDILRVTLPIARAGGRLVTLNCAILLITACKYFWTLIRHYVIPKVPIGFPIDDVMPKYHSYVALNIIFSGCILHTIPQIVNYASEAIAMNHPGMRMWTFGDGFATKQLCLTGTLLTIIFSSFFLTTRKSFRKTAAGFRWFWVFHMCGIASVYPLLIIHGTMTGHPYFLYFNLLPLVMYLLDIYMRKKLVFEAKVLRWKIHDDDGQQITELVLECPAGFVYTPGQYAELSFAPISTREWHPFTIASAPSEDEKSNEVVFFIKNAGRWTGALMDYALDFDLTKAETPPQILIRGPHGAPAMNYFEYRHIVVIGSGVGVTPLLSIWNYLVRKEKTLISQGLRQSKYAVNRFKKWQQSMIQSENILDDSIHFMNQNSSSKLLRLLSSGELFASHLYHHESSRSSTFDKLTEKSLEFGKLQWSSIHLAKTLESMTVSMSLFCLFVLGLTTSNLLWLSGFELAASYMAALLLLCSFIFHGVIVIIWSIAVGRYVFFRLFKCWLELSILIVNSVALSFSIQNIILAFDEQDSRRLYILTFLSFSAILMLQGLRIFHVFYVGLKELSSSDSNDTNDCDIEKKGALKMISSLVTADNSDREEFHSVQGVLVNRKYSNMKFAARSLLPEIIQNGMSDVFSMEFYGTREKSDEKKSKRSLIYTLMGSMTIGTKLSCTECENIEDELFCPGRPDWNQIFLQAISKAHASNEEGESVGVFFCGSPAIAKDLQLEARRVTAQHQFAISHLYGKRCKCKVIVHSENF